MERTWNTNVIHVKFIWNTHNKYMEYTWNTYGISVEYMEHIESTCWTIGLIPAAARGMPGGCVVHRRRRRVTCQNQQIQPNRYDNRHPQGMLMNCEVCIPINDHGSVNIIRSACNGRAAIMPSALHDRCVALLVLHELR